MYFSDSIIEAVWRCSGFRAAVAKKLEDASGGLLPAPMGPARLEERLFLRARTKEEYLESAARAIVSVRARARLDGRRREMAAAMLRERAGKRSAVSAEVAEEEAEDQPSAASCGRKRKAEAADVAAAAEDCCPEEGLAAPNKVPKMVVDI